MHIRGRLVLLVSAVLIPAFAAAALAVWFIYTEEQHAQEKNLKEAARALALLVDNELQNSESLLRGLAVSPLLARGDLPAFYEHIKRLAPTPETTIVVTDASGAQLLNTRLPLDSKLPGARADVALLRAQAGHSRVVVSDLFFAPVGTRHDFAVQVPVPAADNSPPRYYLGRGVSAQLLSDFLARQKLPPNWLASVVDRKGVIVARSAEAGKFVGKRSSGPIASKILSGAESGTNDGYTLEGKHVIAFFNRMPDAGWTAVLSVPADELREPGKHAALLLSALMAAILAGALFVARHYARLTVAPIQQLQHDARALGEGQRVSALRSGLVEVDAVSTALVEASEQVREAKANLEQRVAEAVDAAERAQRALLQAQKLEALGRLTGGVAHDFNNVLQTLSASLQMMEINPDPEKTRARVSACLRAVSRATALVAQMRTFGRMHTDSLTTMAVSDAIASVTPMLQSAVPAAVRLELDVSDALWSARFDAVQFELALLNLVINARDATPGGGTIRVTARNEHTDARSDSLPAGDYIRIAVEDTGEGMPRDVLQRAVEPFFTTKPVDKGTGLGLAQVYGFATQSGGTLVLDSAPGEGTRAIIYLPRDTSQAEHAAAPAVQAPTSPTGSGKVLFVEDDELVHESVSSLLRQAGFEVFDAHSADQALDILFAGTVPDVVFSDIKMPGRDGTELAREIHQRFPTLPVVLATGYTSQALDIDVRLLAKPYSTAEAIHTLMDAIASQRAAKG